MSEVGFPWVTLRRSERLRRFLGVGFALTFTAVVSTAAAALTSPSPLRYLAAAIGIVALAIAWFIRDSRATGVQVRVTPDADVLARADERAEQRLMQPLFIAPWLIVLGDRAGPVPVWPDGLGPLEYRRLAVACRWHRLAADT